MVDARLQLQLSAKPESWPGQRFDTHYNYEDESQEVYNPAASKGPGASEGAGIKAFYGLVDEGGASKPTAKRWCSKRKARSAAAESIDNIARFFGGKPGAGKLAAPARSG